ncbi:MAG TPA: GatB/YqeY domain-containing protein [Saprospiraceae bacterium]|nr:GatB/YqeY domain-containing protein [Saprospiraceae bacterium]
MKFEDQINEDLKTAMKARNASALRGIRAIKSAILLLKTDGSGTELNEEKKIQLLQKMMKQRNDSYDIYVAQGRDDLALVEKEEMDIIAGYLPHQMNAEELENELKKIIATTGASSLADLGKVMGIATKQLAGKADGKQIAQRVKELLS